MIGLSWSVCIACLDWTIVSGWVIVEMCLVFLVGSGGVLSVSVWLIVEMCRMFSVGLC
jgi:hypothetical protein